MWRKGQMRHVCSLFHEMVKILIRCAVWALLVQPSVPHSHAKFELYAIHFLRQLYHTPVLILLISITFPSPCLYVNFILTKTCMGWLLLHIGPFYWMKWWTMSSSTQKLTHLAHCFTHFMLCRLLLSSLRSMWTICNMQMIHNCKLQWKALLPQLIWIVVSEVLKGGSHWMICCWTQKNLKQLSLAPVPDSEVRVLLMVWRSTPFLALLPNFFLAVCLLVQDTQFNTLCVGMHGVFVEIHANV
jgi:hypothetical protein